MCRRMLVQVAVTTSVLPTSVNTTPHSLHTHHTMTPHLHRKLEISPHTPRYRYIPIIGIHRYIPRIGMYRYVPLLVYTGVYRLLVCTSTYQNHIGIHWYIPSLGMYWYIPPHDQHPLHEPSTPPSLPVMVVP